jgi:hypothetical protein
MQLHCWNLLLYWKAIILTNGSYIILISITVHKIIISLPYMYLIMTMQSRLFASWYPLTPDTIGLLISSPLLEVNYFNTWFLYYLNVNYSPLDYYIYTLYLMMAMKSRLLISWYPLTPDAVGLLESSSLLEGNYFNKWFIYYFNINYSPLDYYICTLHLMTAMLSQLLTSRYPLTPDAVWLLESSLFLKSDYFNKWFLYNFIINYSPLDYYIHTLYLIMAMQSRLLTSWYPLTHDVVWLLESSLLLEGNYFNNRFLYHFNINYSLLDYYISTLYLMMAMQSRLLTSWYHLTSDAVGLLESSPLLEGNYFNNRFLYYINIKNLLASNNWFYKYFNYNYSPFDYYISTLYLMTAMLSRLFSSWYSYTHDAIGLLKSSTLLEGNYLNTWFLYNFIINYSPLDYYIHTLYLIMAMQSRLLTSWYPLTHDVVWLLESSLLLEGNYFNNRFLYHFNINYSLLDYYISTLYLMMAMQSRLLTSWYHLTSDAVGLLESSPLLEGNYFNNRFLYYINIKNLLASNNWFYKYFNYNYSPFDYYISTLYLMTAILSRLFSSWYS